jgi:GntR family transcriptional regulator
VGRSVKGARQPDQARRFFARAGHLDRHSPVPLYYQLQEVLKEDIDAGNWQPGEILPSEAELESALGVSRTVVRKALDVLEADGQVVRQKGRGTVVAPPKLLYDAVAAAQEWRSADASGRPVLSEVIDVRLVVAGGNLGKLLGVPADARLFEITAVAAVEGPVSLTQAYVRCDASEVLRAASDNGSPLPLEVGGPELLAQLAGRCGLDLRRSDLTIETTTANEFERDHLSVRGNATTVLVSMVVRGAGDTPLAFLRSVVRSDSFRFTVSVPHEAGAPAAR